MLPKSQTLKYDGTYFEGEDGFIEANSRTYVSDAEGYSIRRQDKPIRYNNEDSLDCSEIYPSRVGKVTKVEVIDEEKNFYDIIDNTIPDNLNYNDYLIEGENMTIIFQSGMLAGDDKAFELKYNHAERRFEIVPQEIDGITMPGGSFVPEVNDTYAIFGCMLPDSYICDNATKTGASWEMFREAARYLYEHEDQRFTFTGELQGMWAKRNWLKIGGKLVVGGYVLFSDSQFAPDGISIRITGIKEYLTSPYSPTIELSNDVTGKSLSSTINELENENVIVDENQKKIILFTKRRFRDSLETIDMLEQALLDNFTNSINPIAVQTMAMLAGDESLQFRFVDENAKPVKYNITYNNDTKQLTCPSGIIQHMTLGIDNISSAHADYEYLHWGMPSFVSPVLDNGNVKYYLYAKVPVDGVLGEFVLSPTAIGLDSISGYYHLLVGILNSEYDGERSFATLYGFTEILPGRITTDRIVSPDGKTYFDLANAEIGGNIKIKAGSSGMRNLEEWDELDTRIETQVTRINSITNRIDSAGWITAADGNRLYASKELENGNTLISYINQAAGSTTIHSDKINLEGAVSFSSLSNSLQGTINEKGNSSSLGNLAYKNQVAEDLLSADLNALINGKADSNTLGGLAYKDAVEAAQLGSTVIVGGYLNTDYIKVNRIDANGAKVGGFTIESGILKWIEYGYGSGKIARTLKLGMSETNTDGVVDISFNANTPGRFGLKAIGTTNGGSAAIYASTNTNSPNYPTGDKTWAAYIDGNIWAGGYFATSLNNNLREGMNGAVRIDNSDTWFVFVKGICVGFTKGRQYDGIADTGDFTIKG